MLNHDFIRVFDGYIEVIIEVVVNKFNKNAEKVFEFVVQLANSVNFPDKSEERELLVLEIEELKQIYNQSQPIDEDENILQVLRNKEEALKCFDDDPEPQIDKVIFDFEKIN